MSNLTTIIQAGLDNPDCAFYTGQALGQFRILQIMLLFFAASFVFKALDKLAIEPILSKLKEWIYGGKPK